MNKKLLIGIVALLLVVGAIALFAPSKSKNTVDITSSEKGRPDVNDSAVIEGGVPPARADVVEGDVPPARTDVVEGDVPVQGGEAMMREVPQESIDACADLDAGDACSFEGAQGSEEGTCTLDREVLACMPLRN